MRAFNLGAVRRALYASAVLTLLSVPSLAQVVERGRTFADLTASHPCDTGLTNRIARVTDCDAADDIGDGEGAFQCWAICDGSAPWVAQAIGGGAGGAGVSGLDTADGGTALADNTIVRGDGTTGIQGSAVTIADTTGDLQWEGTTADAFEGNFTFVNPTADWTWAWGADGSLTGPDGVVVISPVNGTSFYAGSLDGFTTFSVSSSSIELFASVDGTAETSSGFGVSTAGVSVSLQDGLQQYEITADAGFNFVGTRFRINVPSPASASSTCFSGMVAWDADYIYLCIATDTWKRVAIATWP